VRAVAATTESREGDEMGIGGSAGAVCPAFGGVFSLPVKSGPDPGDTFPLVGFQTPPSSHELSLTRVLSDTGLQEKTGRFRVSQTSP
jgi:hypothetical protein